MAIVINGTGTIAGVSATGITTAPTNATDTTKLPLAGGTMTGVLINKAPSSGSTTLQTFQRSDSAVSGEVKYDDTNATRGLQIGTTTQHDFALKTNNTTRLQINYAGNVGINVVPESGWSTKVMQLGRTSIGAGNDATGGHMNWNAYYDGNWKYKDSLEATQYAMNNAHTFKVAPSGSANGAITWTTGFEVLGTGKARAKNGLLFGTDTAAANALDDYEEGTYNVVVTGSTSGSFNMDSNDTFVYTKIGRVVTVQGYAGVASGTVSGNIRINLPFTPAGLPEDGEYNFSSLLIQNTGNTNGGQKYLFLTGGAYGFFYKVEDNGTSGYMNNNDVDNTFQFGVSFSYIAA